MAGRSNKSQTEFDFEGATKSLLSDFSTSSTEISTVKSENVESAQQSRLKPAKAKKMAFVDEVSPPVLAQFTNSKSDGDVIIDFEEESDNWVSNEPQVMSVSDLNQAIKNQLESEFPLVWVKGEISNCKTPPSGHLYFSLKDSNAQVRSVMFKGHSNKLNFKPEDGMEVIVRARVSVYAPRGDYQIICDQMDPVGMGALQIAFDQLKKKLEAEGLFDPTRKRVLPSLPKRIAIVTSPTGAAIRDMLNVLSRRFKGAEITLIPTMVQGEKATPEIVKAIEMANAVVPAFDVMIVGRGGGSIEDLWCFNEESVARAIANSKIPTVSAVGHEIDFTIADFVADLRAPTPSAAAELVVKNASDLSDKIRNLNGRLKLSIAKKFERQKLVLASLKKGLIDPRRKLLDLIQRCDELYQRLERGVLRYLSDKRDDLKQSMSLLDSLSPLKVVERGYSIVKVRGVVVKKSDQIKKGDELEIQFAKGTAVATVSGVQNGKGV